MRLRRKQAKICVIRAECHGKKERQYSQATQPLDKSPPEQDALLQGFDVREERDPGCGETAYGFKIGIQEGHVRTKPEGDGCKNRQDNPCHATNKQALQITSGAGAHKPSQ